VITRRWRGWTTTPGDADAYVAHFDGSVRPQLAALDGFLGASLEVVPADDGRTEIVVVTRWDSMDAIHAFAGDDLDAAQVEPAARAVLDAFEERVTHGEVLDHAVFDHLTLIDVAAEAAAHEPWFNETLTTVNDTVVRLGVLEGEFHWTGRRPCCGISPSGVSGGSRPLMRRLGPALPAAAWSWVRRSRSTTTRPLQ
jgi:heme-degrading monooxygenase HmoA